MPLSRLPNSKRIANSSAPSVAAAMSPAAVAAAFVAEPKAAPSLAMPFAPTGRAPPTPLDPNRGSFLLGRTDGFAILKTETIPAYVVVKERRVERRRRAALPGASQML